MARRSELKRNSVALVENRHLPIFALAARVVAGCAIGLGTACNEAPPPLASALVVVDTDLPVPKAISHLRVDVYGADGLWRESRDFPRVRPDEWPASFGLVSPDESKPTDVIVRLRAFPESGRRDYRGERAEVRPTYEPIRFPANLAELCASVEDLPPHEERTLRRGLVPFTADRCQSSVAVSSRSGSVAVRVTIPTRDTYRFEVVRTMPLFELGIDTTLALRRDCNDSASEIACHDNIDEESNWLSSLVVDLDPGTYTLLSNGNSSDAAEITLRWSKASEWNTTLPPGPPVAAAREPTPRLLVRGEDKTPVDEPHPASTVERFVRVRLEPGVQATKRVVLGGGCLGTPARVTSAGADRIDVGAVQTCIDGDGTHPIPEAESVGTLPPSAVGTYLAEKCGEEDSDDNVVCVPGGAFVMGGPEMDNLDLSGRGHTLPVRTVALTRFWMDRREVTVGRYRQAVAAGFRTQQVNESPLDNAGPLDTQGLKTGSTYSARAMNRERYPLNGIGWHAARDFCAFFGGDIQTEAQWEYVAGGADAPSKRTYPWGEAEASCDITVIDRAIAPVCKGFRGPEPVDAASMAADVGALGVLGLGGNLREYTRDAANAFDDPCWAAKSAVDAWCDDPAPAYRIARGGSWNGPFVFARVSARWPMLPSTRSTDVGFRCTYPRKPERTWSGP